MVHLLAEGKTIQEGARNSMVSHQHLAKNGATKEDNRGIMGKHTCPLYNQLKRDP